MRLVSICWWVDHVQFLIGPEKRLCLLNLKIVIDLTYDCLRDADFSVVIGSLVPHLLSR